MLHLLYKVGLKSLNPKVGLVGDYLKLIEPKEFLENIFLIVLSWCGHLAIELVRLVVAYQNKLHPKYWESTY